MLDIAARKNYDAPFSVLSVGQQETLKAYLRVEMKANTYQPDTGTIIVTEDRKRAIEQVGRHYAEVFQNTGSENSKRLREQYAFSPNTTIDDQDLHALTAFVFWTAWSATTTRPEATISYTSKWPYEPLVGNTPSASVFLWTFVSIFLLLAGIGALVWFYAKQYDLWRDDLKPEGGVSTVNLLRGAKVTPSMRATGKYFWTVVALIGVQILLGAITAHYAVEGHEFYGIPIAEYLPYSVTRTWHTQLAVFWIATAWLATGLYMAPLVSGYEPPFQRFGVNFLFLCLLIIVVGSLLGEWLGIHQYFDNLTMNFWFGHQGYEYVDLGRFWQIFLFIGLLVWLGLILRALLPAFRGTQQKSLILLLVVASVSIALLYGAGLMWGQNTHISVMEYWRWWVVHLWVEGVFEVFATTIIALLFVKMGLLRQSTATISSCLQRLFSSVAGCLEPSIICTGPGRPSQYSRWAGYFLRWRSCHWW